MSRAAAAAAVIELPGGAARAARGVAAAAREARGVVAAAREARGVAAAAREGEAPPIGGEEGAVEGEEAAARGTREDTQGKIMLPGTSVADPGSDAFFDPGIRESRIIFPVK
jgi:hypothetical protein